MNIILCGLPGSGKTTVGKIIAEQLGRPFFDTDRLLENHYAVHMGQSFSCREIAKELSESGFRALEAEALAEISNVANGVIATGGGILTYSASAELLRSMGCLIYLRASPEEILERLLRNGMPTYLDPQDPLSSFQKLAEKRRPFYDSLCHLTVNIDGKNPDQIAKKILLLSNVWSTKNAN